MAKAVGLTNAQPNSIINLVDETDPQKLGQTFKESLRLLSEGMTGLNYEMVAVSGSSLAVILAHEELTIPFLEVLTQVDNAVFARMSPS